MGWLKNNLSGWGTYLIGLGIILLVILFSYTSFYQGIENRLLDLRFNFRQSIPISGQITHIDIDDGSIDTIGRWPWSRDKHVRLLELLNDLRAKAVVFDIDFCEPGEIFVDTKTLGQELIPLFEQPPAENDSVKEHQSYIAKMQRSVYNTIYDYDPLFANAIKHIGSVYLTCNFPKHPTKPIDKLPKSLVSGRIKHPSGNRLTTEPNEHILMPLKLFADQARGLGFVDIEPDSDGVLRRVALVKEYQGHLYPQLGFRVACETLGITPDMITIVPGEKIELKRQDQPPIVIPIDNEGKTVINWVGNIKVTWEQTFDHLPYDHLVETVWQAKQNLVESDGETTEAEQTIMGVMFMVKDKICLVGMAATGCTDMKPTPNEPLLPGVMLHSSLINMILTNNFIHRTPKWANLLILIGCGILITLIAGRFNPMLSILSSIIIILVGAWIAFRVFSVSGIWVDVTGPLFVSFLGFASIKAYRTIVEEKAKRQVQNTFGHYLAPQVINEILKNPDKLKLGGEKKVITVFFSDIANFTNMSSGLAPEVIMDFVNRYLSAMTDIIQDYYGMIDKYEGDAIMALFGAPLERPDHAKLACWSAIDNIKKLPDLNEYYKTIGIQPIGIRVGINTGEMVVGNLGSEKVKNYTVMGEEVILASRLEGVNKFYNTKILASENTYQQAKEYVEAREVDYIRAKGMGKAVRIYEIIAKKGEADSSTQELIANYSLALTAYHNHQWEKAIGFFDTCLKIRPEDGPSSHLLEQCQKLKQFPPGTDWDVIRTLTAK